MELRVQKLLQPCPAAASAWVVEFDFECLENGEWRFHLAAIRETLPVQFSSRLAACCEEFAQGQLL